MRLFYYTSYRYEKVQWSTCWVQERTENMQNQNGDPVKTSPWVFTTFRRVWQKVRGEFEEISDAPNGN